MVATLAFFVPILEKTEATGGAGLSAEEITRLTLRFTSWNILRMALLAGTWVAGIRALVLVSRVEPASARLPSNPRADQVLLARASAAG